MIRIQTQLDYIIGSLQVSNQSLKERAIFELLVIEIERMWYEFKYYSIIAMKDEFNWIIQMVY